MKSIVTDNKTYCIFCGNYATCDHHLIFGTSGRAFSEKYGLKVPICATCHKCGEIKSRIHDNPMAEHLSKMLGQAMYEQMVRATDAVYAEKVKDYCESHTNCGECGFFNGTCRFNNIPANWTLTTKLSPERDSL